MYDRHVRTVQYTPAVGTNDVCTRTTYNTVCSVVDCALWERLFTKLRAATRRAKIYYYIIIASSSQSLSPEYSNGHVHNRFINFFGYGI